MKRDDMKPQIGDNVRTNIVFQPVYRTTIAEIRYNELGTVIYVMTNGQFLTRREFTILELFRETCE